MLSQVDSEGRHFQVLTEGKYHKRDYSAIKKVDGFIKSINGNLDRKKTTRGWKLLVERKEGSVDWVTLKELKQSNLVEFSEYDAANYISDKTALR